MGTDDEDLHGGYTQLDGWIDWVQNLSVGLMFENPGWMVGSKWNPSRGHIQTGNGIFFFYFLMSSQINFFYSMFLSFTKRKFNYISYSLTSN